MAITNKAIIELYKAEHGLPVNYPLYTYAAWLNQGYRVRKGEKCKHKVQLWKYEQRTSEQDGQKQTAKRCFFKTANLFAMDQVEKVKV